MNKQTAVDVLVVDDDREFNKFVAGVAEGLGLSVASLQNSNEFKREFEALRPKVVVLDIAMPGIDGVQLSRWLGQQRQQHNREVRVILVTGYGVDFLRLCGSIAALSGLDNIQGLSKPIEHDAMAMALLGESK